MSVKDDCYSSKELASFLGVGKPTIGNMIKQNRAPKHFRLPGGRKLMFLKSDVEKWWRDVSHQHGEAI